MTLVTAAGGPIHVEEVTTHRRLLMTSYTSVHKEES
jgi:hypothetical protein